ncbi:MAG: hypothetical protein EKK41_14010 [Hyphomicrobiales bacterium]|nr:MAG: hypothetical protein EKK41_14010 [Hyphomicrobiales bacterium]
MPLTIRIAGLAVAATVAGALLIPNFKSRPAEAAPAARTEPQPLPAARYEPVATFRIVPADSSAAEHTMPRLTDY